MSMIDERLETLLVVAREKNFTRAGDILGLTQPAVSGHMKRLEEELKVNLFLRKRASWPCRRRAKWSLNTQKG